MTFTLSFSMYYLSFIPLWITVLFMDIKSLIEGGANKCTEIIGIACIVVFSVWTFICLYYNFRCSRSGTFDEYKLEEVSECKTITSEFLLSYILPLFAFDFCTWDGVVEFLIFFCVLGWLSIKHNCFSVNIVLEIMKYKMYECKLTNQDDMSRTLTVISRKSLSLVKGSEIKLKSINNEISLDVAEK